MTTETLASLLLLAATAAASPFSLIAFSIVLATDRGPRNGIAFICGWIVTVTLIGVAMAALGANFEFRVSNPAGKWTFALELALGVILLFLWARRRFGPKVETPTVEAEVESADEPGWQKKLTTMGYAGAFVAGGAVQTWPVMIAAAAQILLLDIGSAERLGWMFLFALSTTAGIVVLEVLAWRNPGSAGDRLRLIRSYVSTHRDSVISWLYLIAGLWLFFRALVELV